MSAATPLRAATEVYQQAREEGATELGALDVAVREALRRVGRPLPGTSRGGPTGSGERAADA